MVGFFIMKEIHLSFAPSTSYLPVIIPFEAKNNFFSISGKTKKVLHPFPFHTFVHDDFNCLTTDEIQHKAESPANHATKRFVLSVSKQEYLKTVEALQQHIQRGDVYEVNYCIELFADNVFINPYGLYLEMLEQLNQPFSGLVRYNDFYLICASPERYLKKTANTVISQPMKGTAARGTNPQEDLMNKNRLLYSAKERAENVMIVDLVRNDLSKIAQRGSVKVDEIFGIYTFSTVHQMISTVSAQVREDVQLEDIVQATFPMGSMTGAPKYSALKLIDKYEKNSRGLYSGSIGYLLSNGDFDLNVVIRSFQYNRQIGRISLWVGSAITTYANPEEEWKECLLKAEALLSLVNGRVEYT